MIFFALLIAVPASAPTTIDTLFAHAQESEKKGLCEEAGDDYTAILELGKDLEPGLRTQVEAQAKARLARTEACRLSCTLSASDQSLFATAKIAHANNEPKRVAELCAQLLRNKDDHCRSTQAMLAFCPTPPAVVDPCAAPRSVRGDVSNMPARVKTLQERTSEAIAAGEKGLDRLAEIDEEIAVTHERIFDLRERFLRCDGIYSGLVARDLELKVTRNDVAAAMRTAYVARLATVSEELATLKGERQGFEQKLHAVSRLNDELMGDVMKLVHTQAFRTSVTVEGIDRGDAAAEAALAKALKGERAALEALIEERPEFFGDASDRALQTKREELARLDMMLGRLSRSNAHGLGFEKARAELKQSIALVDNALDFGERRAHKRATSAWLYVFGLVAAVSCTIIFVRWRRPDDEIAVER